MIKAYIGLLGAGKTLSMINDAIRDIERGRRVVSNVPFTWHRKGKVYSPVFISSDNFHNALLKEKNCLFLIDEASIVLPSHYWNRMSGDFLIKFAQARKYGLDIYYTSQGWNHTVKRLRDLTNFVTVAKKHNPLGYTFFSNITYDPSFFDFKIMPQAEIEKRFILKRKIISHGRAKKIYKAYDTLYLIDNEDIRNQSSEGGVIIGRHDKAENTIVLDTKTSANSEEQQNIENGSENGQIRI